MIKSRKETKKNGFTLVEVLVTTAILAVAICGVLLVYSGCSALIVTSRASNIAMSAAVEMMENITDFASSDYGNTISTYNLRNFTINDWPPINGTPQAIGVAYVVNNTTGNFLQVTVSVCWRQGKRIIGEDVNLNGKLDAGEDKNGNGIIDSPVQLVTRIVNR
jgi:prepilin-type N-terminal cleavage/methylation domain-containing protein